MDFPTCFWKFPTNEDSKESEVAVHVYKKVKINTSKYKPPQTHNLNPEEWNSLKLYCILAFLF